MQKRGFAGIDFDDVQSSAEDSSIALRAFLNLRVAQNLRVHFGTYALCKICVSVVIYSTTQVAKRYISEIRVIGNLVSWGSSVLNAKHHNIF